MGMYMPQSLVCGLSPVIKPSEEQAGRGFGEDCLSA